MFLHILQTLVSVTAIYTHDVCLFTSKYSTCSMYLINPLGYSHNVHDSDDIYCKYHLLFGNFHDPF